MIHISQGDWCSERLCDLPKVTQWKRNRTGIWTEAWLKPRKWENEIVWQQKWAMRMWSKGWSTKEMDRWKTNMFHFPSSFICGHIVWEARRQKEMCSQRQTSLSPKLGNLGQPHFWFSISSSGKYKNNTCFPGFSGRLKKRQQQQKQTNKQNRKQPECPSAGKQTLGNHSMEYLSSIKCSKLLIYTTWVDLKKCSVNAARDKRVHTVHTNCMIPITWTSRKN